MLDFSTLNPDEVGDGAGIDLPSGVYKATVTSCKPSNAKGTGRAQHEFKLSVTEDPYKGAVRTEWISDSTGPDDKVNFVWVRAFQSIGITPEKLKQVGRISEDKLPSLFEGKPCFFEYTKGNQDMGQKDKVKFLTGAAYKVKKEQMAAQAAMGVSAPANVTTAQAAASIAPAAVAVVAAPIVQQAAGDGGDLMALLNG